MIKLLSLLGSIGIMGTSASSVTACGNSDKAQKLNFFPLDNAIEKADSRLKTSNDKPKSAKEKLNIVVDEAKLQRQKATSQVIINQTAEKVETAIVIFDSTLLADKTQLRIKVAEAKELLKLHNKGADVKINLQTAIELAEAILNDPDVIQEKVDRMLKRLEDAIELFKNSPDLADKTKLKKEINLANQLLGSSKKPNSVNKKLQDAIAKAQLTFNKEMATQAEVDQAVTDLAVEVRIFQSAKDLADKTKLQAKIDEAKLLLKNSANASEMAKEFFQLSINGAEMVLKDETASQESVDTALKNLQEALEAFSRAKLIDKTQLEAELKQAKQIVTNSNKPKEVIEALKTAIVKAQAIFDKETATQTEVDQAVVDLKVEIRIFQSARDLADKTALKAKIDEANKLLEANRKNKPSYTIQAMELALNVAQTIMDKETANQDEVDNTTAKLEEAIQLFNQSPDLAKDKTELAKLIVEAKELLKNNPGKGEDAKKFFQLFITWAEDTFNDPNATQSDIDIEVITLQKAMETFKNAQ